MTVATASDRLGLIALDGMAVARTLLDRLARDPVQAAESTERDLASARQAAELLDLTAGIDEAPAAAARNQGRPKREPIDQPIAMLPVIAKLIDEQLADARELYATLSDARRKPHVLDDRTVERVQRVYDEKREFLPDYQRQLSRWQALTLSAGQRAQVDRLAGELVPLRDVIETTLELADELKRGTIDAIMRTSDLQLGVETLLGLRPRP
jgi:hypothetical protein